MSAVRRFPRFARVRAGLLSVLAIAIWLTGSVSVNASSGRDLDDDRFTVPEPSPQLQTEMIPPRETDPEIDIALQPHYVAFDPSARRQKRLFLFLSGATSLPAEGPLATRLITEQAAANGFHAINLRYASDQPLASICNVSIECWEPSRLAIIYGGRLGTIDVSRANSIENRLVKLLAFLHARNPDQGWSRFLDDNRPKWSRIIVAGWSQGGSHAALIARDNRVARVIMLEAPVDRSPRDPAVNDPFRPAPWIADKHVTPTGRYFGLAHKRSFNTLGFYERAWGLLGMDRFGGTVDVDKAEPPFDGSHQLQTNREALRDMFHASVAADAVTPRDANGRPVLAAAWQYMMVAPTEGDDDDED